MESICKLRVRYGETDQMGVVYYGNYALYLEEARTSLIRETGLSYRSMEERAIMLPVINLNIKYFRSASYDDEITMKTVVKELTSRKVTFYTEMFLSEGVQLNACEVTLMFMNKHSKKIMSIPSDILNSLKKYIAS